jgi:NADPH:quinone reductase-like Zn-dependent oxidoreductase
MRKDFQVMFVQKEQAALVERDFDPALAPGQILGQNLLSLISTGSERGGFTQQFRPEQYPMPTGSSSIARVIGVGEGVTRYREGDLFYHGDNHTLLVKADEGETVPVPPSLEPEKALFARYAAVSMTSIYRMGAKPVDKIIVTGLGLVGLMCAQVLGAMGFEVYAVDPSQERREIARETNVRNVGPRLSAWPELAKSAGGMLECSGNELALRDAIPYLRPGSDVFQVGVPWHKTSEWDAHTLLYDLFYGYISLHGGWEWYLPKKGTEFQPHSNYYHIGTVMKLIADGKVAVVPGMYELRDPRECGKVYGEIAIPRMKPTSMMLDWRDLGREIG